MYRYFQKRTHESGTGTTLRSRASRFVLASGVLALGLGFSSGHVAADPPQKIAICHATSAQKNPYTRNKVDTSSVDASGHGDHDGPLFPAENWGDIIPPYGEFPGLNWPEGQSILENRCRLVTDTTTTTGNTITVVDPTTTTTTTAADPTTTAEPATTSTTAETTTSLGSEGPLTPPAASGSPLPSTGAGSNRQLAVLGALMILLGGAMMIGTRRPLSLD